MNIDTIKNGYVIDHITAGNAIKIYKLLNLGNLDCTVALITNVKSTTISYQLATYPLASMIFFPSSVVR